MIRRCIKVKAVECQALQGVGRSRRAASRVGNSMIMSSGRDTFSSSESASVDNVDSPDFSELLGRNNYT